MSCISKEAHKNTEFLIQQKNKKYTNQKEKYREIATRKVKNSK